MLCEQYNSAEAEAAALQPIDTVMPVTDEQASTAVEEAEAAVAEAAATTAPSC